MSKMSSSLKLTPKELMTREENLSTFTKDYEERCEHNARIEVLERKIKIDSKNHENEKEKMIEDKNQEIKSLKKELGDLEIDVAHKNEKITQLDTANRRKDVRLEKNEHDIKELKMVNEELRQQAEALQTKISFLEEERCKQKITAQRSEEKTIAMDSELCSLKEQLSLKQAEKTVLENRIAELQSEVDKGQKMEERIKRQEEESQRREREQERKWEERMKMQERQRKESEKEKDRKWEERMKKQEQMRDEKEKKRDQKWEDRMKRQEKLRDEMDDRKDRKWGEIMRSRDERWEERFRKQKEENDAGVKEVIRSTASIQKYLERPNQWTDKTGKTDICIHDSSNLQMNSYEGFHSQVYNTRRQTGQRSYSKLQYLEPKNYNPFPDRRRTCAGNKNQPFKK